MADADAPGPSLSVVVPARNAAPTLAASLDALRRAGFAAADVLVVDDGSTDRTAEIAAAAGARLVRNETGRGAAEARNLGATMSGGDILVFVDADVVVHVDVRQRIIAAFREDPGLDALFGSYDDAPPARSVVSRYRNLLHHFVHQNSREEAATFWTGLGAVRREVFLRLGGLDRSWQDIEDVEFGVRLCRAGGRIRLDRGLLGAHLKAWTLRSMVRTDLRGRALPWSRLVLSGAVPADDLNLTLTHRLSAMSALALVVAIGATLVEPAAAYPAAAAGAAFLLVNRRFLTFLARRHGLTFAVAAVPCHLLHYSVAVAGYAWVRLVEPWRRAR